MTIQIGVYRIVTYPACSIDDLLRMGIKPGYSYDIFFYVKATHIITESELFAKVIGYDYSDPTLCYLGDTLYGLQVIADNRVYHLSFWGVEKSFVIELLTPVMAVILIDNSLFVIHEVGIRKISLAGDTIWDITTDDSVKNFRVDTSQEYLLLELHNSRRITVDLSTGHSTVQPKSPVTS